jgi:hypothetical protein
MHLCFGAKLDYQLEDREADRLGAEQPDDSEPASMRTPIRLAGKSFVPD